jgi:hypothetical protein
MLRKDPDAQVAFAGSWHNFDDYRPLKLEDNGPAN